MNANPSVLYLSYDGMLEPLGQSQVLCYLERLAASWPIHLLSFEKADDRSDPDRMAAMRDRTSAAGITWHPLAYHRTPSAPATAYDIAVGTAVALRIARRHRVGIVHARSYVAATMALGIKRLTGACFLFDMRGFWADERVDGGLWSRDGRLYRAAKAMERRFLLSSDHVVTLTRASVREIVRFDYLAGRVPPITVIPTCADLERFRPRRADPDRPLTFGYVGSVGTWYLFDETLAFFNVLRRRRPEATLLVVNRSEHAAIRQAVRRAGIPEDRLELLAAEHPQVPEQIARMHVAAAVIKPSYSKIASAATKLAEYLGCGVPCVGNTGVGDMEEVLEGHRVGVALRGFSESEMEAGVDRLLALLADPETAQRCVGAARELFSLDEGVEAYHRIYRTLVVRRVLFAA
jgi:glycosyltransferase involved in cell wall biosynthesis